MSTFYSFSCDEFCFQETLYCLPSGLARVFLSHYPQHRCSVTKAGASVADSACRGAAHGLVTAWVCFKLCAPERHSRETLPLTGVTNTGRQWGMRDILSFVV